MVYFIALILIKTPLYVSNTVSNVQQVVNRHEHATQIKKQMHIQNQTPKTYKGQ